MVAGDVCIGDGLTVLNEGDAFVVAPSADADVEVTNIYTNGTLRMGLMTQGDFVLLPLDTITESQFNLGIHLDEGVVLQLMNDGPDPVTVAVDGIYTRRPPTVFT